ncbi:MAG: hypothetical protein Q9194_001230 [Teloschistes cf. exilis]
MASSDTDSMPSYPLTPSSPHVTQQPMTAFAPTISFSPTWQTLGPFQIGTREATWGADPLETLGGFHCLPYNESATFPSSLATNGTVSWSTVEASIPSPAPTSLPAQKFSQFRERRLGFSATGVRVGGAAISRLDKGKSGCAR